MMHCAVALIAGLFSIDSSWAAQCRSDIVFPFTFDFTKSFDSPSDNKPMSVMQGAHRWSLGRAFSTSCFCGAGNTFDTVYFTVVTKLPLGFQATVNGKQLQFYKLNRHLQVAAEIGVENQHGYTAFPFSSLAASVGVKACSSNPDNLLIATGNRGQIHLLIDQPFIGETIIPTTRLFELYGDTSPNAAPYGKPVMWIEMSGKVSVPQSCGLTPGQPTTFDFGKVVSSAIALPGTENPRYSQERTFAVTCKNITSGIKLSLESAAAPAHSNVFAAHNRSDMGIQVRNKGNIISPLIPGAAPKSGNIIPLQVDYVQQTSRFTILAYPVRTKPSVEPGPFEATATLKFDFE
ncbi:fimbrial protein [Pseudomonas sp. TCU-HL1]|uniref:fimbrial protein n=1 Tax=Pseudomonas sp. TCU-HL1 TaxID=1856685 RepID=UPI00083CBF76|nr:fimbrial protein [Pseudomonas sp. TCU-HL1]AOE85740.1 hypothetical protein THL1_3192 [Pseudomonas sp. TCU-HL1]